MRAAFAYISEGSNVSSTDHKLKNQEELKGAH